MNLGNIRENLMVWLADVPGARPFAYRPDSVPAGAGDVVIVREGEPYVDYHEAFAGGLAIVNLVFEVWLQFTNNRSATARLDELMSSGAGEARSLIDSLMYGHEDRTLGGECADFVVDGVSNIRVELAAEARYLVADFDLRVFARRS